MNMKYQNSLGIFYKIINLGETHTMSSTSTCISQASLLIKLKAWKIIWQSLNYSTLKRVDTFTKNSKLCSTSIYVYKSTSISIFVYRSHWISFLSVWVFTCSCYIAIYNFLKFTHLWKCATHKQPSNIPHNNHCWDWNFIFKLSRFVRFHQLSVNSYQT